MKKYIYILAVVLSISAVAYAFSSTGLLKGDFTALNDADVNLTVDSVEYDEDTSMIGAYICANNVSETIANEGYREKTSARNSPKSNQSFSFYV